MARLPDRATDVNTLSGVNLYQSDETTTDVLVPMTRIRCLNSMLSEHPTKCQIEMKECEALFFSLMSGKLTNN